MPFKPGKAPKDLLARYKGKVKDITTKQAEAVMTKITVYAAGASKEIAPIEFGNLINSQFRRVEKTSTGYRGTVGYAVGYAAALENPKAGGRLDGWKPVAPENKQGNAWNPISGQGFLRLAFTGQESAPAIQKIIINGFRIK